MFIPPTFNSIIISAVPLDINKQLMEHDLNKEAAYTYQKVMLNRFYIVATNTPLEISNILEPLTRTPGHSVIRLVGDVDGAFAQYVNEQVHQAVNQYNETIALMNRNYD